MCNAWNHHPSCSCGWGGGGYSGGSSSSGVTLFNKYPYVPAITSSYESYTNPNALCPVCKDQVFFYQSPDGGRVFFDELGPPWPKHGCTDNFSAPVRIENYIAEERKIYGWQKKGWKPFYITGSKIIDISSIRVFGIFDGVERGIYIERLGIEDELEIGPKHLAQIKRVNELYSIISIAFLGGELLNKKAYIFSSDVPRSKKNNEIKNKVKTLKQKAPNKPKAKLKSKPKPKPSNHAMSEAFKKAGFKRE